MIVIGSDHAAVREKQRVIDFLRNRGLEVRDVGATNERERVDYPDYAKLVADGVLCDDGSLGILLCGTGIGMSIAANKIRGIRCAHCTDTFSAKMAREHNDANIIALGANITGTGLMLEIVEAFLTSSFSNEERHINRLNKIKNLERN